MHEDLTKYLSAERIQTSPMVDARVIIFADRTALELGVPFLVAVVTFAVIRNPWLAVVVPPALFWGMPWLRNKFGRGRLFHLLWSRGIVSPSQMPFAFDWNQRIKTFGP